ncbi:MAG: bifunctional (p)ppGpp synthetase/guanosine-3',5'-bis(diphosphate) 3'-pyrophosphohydrolase, partial [Betaproteobacteria bacterium]|nr:bifunctional (p)ppGpp synthetase/guanosine-3',5'-bis(diphosphate) 3'-pyrophosphohydrolase [Betaproteobacteria bacterium]
MATDILSPVDTLTNLRSRLAAAEPSHTEQAQVRYPLTLRVLDYLMTVADTTQRPTEWGRALAAAEVLLGIEADDETLAAMLIVGTLPRKDWDIPWLTDTFGVDMAGLVGGVLRVGRIDNVSAGSDAGPGVETLRKMLLALADDVRVVLILLADRVTYLRSITRADEAVRRAAAQLTRDLYAPLANRLGVFAIKWELEDFAFRYLQPDLYKRIATLLDGKRGEREAYIQRLVALLKSELTKAGIQGEIAGRPKHIWSIHRKMQSKNLPFERLYDVRAVRVLVESVADCYAVLALVHALWTPIEGEFDDYIAQPKANNYRSLHTAVRGPEGKTLEVQIRTHEMHQTSENGVAAHWRYKEGGGHKTSADRKFEAKIAWLRQVLAWRHELVDQGGFSAEVKQNLFDDTLYVFTPQGKVI